MLLAGGFIAGQRCRLPGHGEQWKACVYGQIIQTQSSSSISSVCPSPCNVLDPVLCRALDVNKCENYHASVSPCECVHVCVCAYVCMQAFVI